MNNYIWCSNDYLTIEDDMCTHLETHLFFYSQIKNSLDSGLGMGNVIRTISELLKNSPILYPPLVYLISSFVNSILGTGHLVVTRLTQMIYFAILISSVYEIGKICFDKKSVIIAALLVSFYPGIVGASRLYTLDLPLTSFTALAIYCLIKTKYFSNFKRSIIFGVILGVGIMIKGQILFFVIGPLVYIFFKSFFKMGKNKSEKLICGRNYILALVISGIGSSLWWWPRFNLLLDRFMFLLFEVSENPLVPVMKLDVLSVNWLFSYVYFSLNNVSPVLFGLFLLGLLSSLKAQFEYKGIIISWILGSYYILSMFSMKIDRFFMPAFPAIAIITIVFFYSIKNIVFQRALLAATVGFAVFQAMFLSYYPKSHDITVAAQRNSIFYFITPMHDPEILGEKEA
ncbi:MAG: glycosyltransferase family 39 protein [Candidatus Omnitrophica bacterium]|nr:glycosyltransferase family 39 protein [Candidatus Omnitrophota bacterium]